MNAVVGWIDNGTVRGEFTSCLTKLVAYSTYRDILGGLVRRHSGPIVEEGRNGLVEQFLDGGDIEWLLQIDTDMTFEMDALEKLLLHANVDTAPVVGGLCYGFAKDHGQFPTLYRRDGQVPRRLMQVPDGDGLYPVDATGAACLLTHRSVFEDNRRDGPLPWFHRRQVTGHDGKEAMLGEDLSWCFWLRDRGVPIAVALDVEFGHVKPVELNRATFEANRKQVLHAVD